MIYQLLSPVTFRDSPAHPVSFISKHGYDWLNADKQLEFWKYFSAQLESIVILSRMANHSRVLPGAQQEGRKEGYQTKLFPGALEIDIRFQRCRFQIDRLGKLKLKILISRSEVGINVLLLLVLFRSQILACFDIFLNCWLKTGHADSRRAPGLTCCLQDFMRIHLGTLKFVSHLQCIGFFVLYMFMQFLCSKVNLKCRFCINS